MNLVQFLLEILLQNIINIFSILIFKTISINVLRYLK
jgi:hypothetical protein